MDSDSATMVLFPPGQQLEDGSLAIVDFSEFFPQNFLFLCPDG